MQAETIFSLERTCALCGKQFDTNMQTIRAKKSSRFFCSKDCADLFEIKTFALPPELIPKFLSLIKGKHLSITKRRRLLAMLMINPRLRCSNCGCDVVDLLEINHVNGDGNKDRVIRYKNYYAGFLNDIITRRRFTEDLDLRCIVCNALYRVEKLGHHRFKVIFN